MNAAFLIASRELRDRGRLFLIAACMAVVPFFAAFAVREHRQLAIATVAVFVAAAYTGALALAIGVSMVGRDLTEKRLSFLFAKPISSASIWFGKVTGGILTWVGAFAIVILPTYLFARQGWRELGAGGLAVLGFTLGISLVLFFASHAASTMLRSRSALVALDFTLLVLMLLALFGLVRPILLGGGMDVVTRIVSSVGLAMLVTLAIAPVWQIARGRIDPRRNHAAFSAALWSSAGVIMLVAAAYAIWVISPPLSSLTEMYTINQSPSGDWMYVSGQTKNRGEYLASFLVHPKSGERERVPISPWAGGVHRTPDGRSMIWMQYDELTPWRSAFRFYKRRLEPGARPQATELVMAMPRNLQLSDDGARIAVTRTNRLEVYDLATGKQLGVTQGIKDSDVATMYFAGPNVVRVVEIGRGTQPMMVIHSFDLTTRKLTSAAPRMTGGLRGVHFNRDGSRMYVRGEGVVLDAATGAVLSTQTVKPARSLYGAMLRDGSTIVSNDSKLYHYDVNGALVAEIAIPAQRAFLTGQFGATKLLMSSGGSNTAEWKSFVVDLTTRKVESVTPGIRDSFAWWSDSIVPHFTEDATILTMAEGRKLVMWDPRTGTTRPFGM